VVGAVVDRPGLALITGDSVANCTDTVHLEDRFVSEGVHVGV
jgi:hypothetical protein